MSGNSSSIAASSSALGPSGPVDSASIAGYVLSGVYAASGRREAGAVERQAGQWVWSGASAESASHLAQWRQVALLRVLIRTVAAIRAMTSPALEVSGHSAPGRRYGGSRERIPLRCKASSALR